jgi:hypothetical protein
MCIPVSVLRAPCTLTARYGFDFPGKRKAKMNQYRILFDELEWHNPIHGMRLKSFRSGAKQLRLVEFRSEFVEPDWCEKGHISYVIQGELEINFHGHLVRYPQGSGIFIPSGAASSHKGRSVTPTALLFLVDEI